MSRYSSSTRSGGKPLPKDYGIPIKFQSRPRKTTQDVMNWYSKGPNPSIDRYRIHKTQQPQKYGISRIPSYTNNNYNPLEKSYKSNNPTEKLYKNNNNMAGKHSHLNGEPAVTYDGTQQQQPSTIEELIRNLREEKYSIDEDKLKEKEETSKTEHYNENNTEQNEEEEKTEPKETFESALEKIRNNLDDIPEQSESSIEKQLHNEDAKDRLQSISSIENKDEPLSLDEITEQARELNRETKDELQDATTGDTIELEQQQQEEFIINQLSDKLESLPTELFENNPDQTEFRKRNQDYDSMEYTGEGGQNYY